MGLGPTYVNVGGSGQGLGSVGCLLIGRRGPVLEPELQQVCDSGGMDLGPPWAWVLRYIWKWVKESELKIRDLIVGFAYFAVVLDLHWLGQSQRVLYLTLNKAFLILGLICIWTLVFVSTSSEPESPTPFLCGITIAAGTLYTYPENWRAFKALIAAQYSGAQVRVLSVPPHFHFGQTNRTPEFLRKFPAGKVPAFEGDDGFCVFESNAIAYYVSNEELQGSTPEAAAQVVQWVSFADSDIVPPASTWVFPTLGIMHHNKQATENAKEEVRRILGLLDAHLKTRTFLVGERVTLADITVVCTLLWLYKQVLEPSFRQAFPNTNRWFLTCINQPQFQAILGEVKLCEKMAQFDAKKFAESQPKKDTPRKEKGSREEKQKPQAEWKEEKKAAASAPEEEMDECEKALPTEPKAKDPFAHLPKSTFVLDEFKRKYSNEDTLSVALPYFGEHFDKDGWSLWYAEYRFPEELTQTFMSCNLITGMFQRLDKLRKNAFASVILFGTNNSSSISGVWVF
uniref:elongation factor 1-gamma-like n=1 Tax=Callospermophilus lateralis TaxID=76772 RepID=UPI00403863B6